MSNTRRKVAVGFAALRIGYALGLLAAPERVARAWVGSAADSPGGDVALRGLGARDLVLSAGVAAFALSGRDARPWLAACAVSDAADLSATLLAPGSALPDRAKPGAVALAGGFGALGAVLAAHEDLAG
jgi:hypothetical protein